MQVGKQLLVELWGCDRAKTDKSNEVATLMRRAVLAMKSKPVHSSYRGLWPGVAGVNVTEDGHLTFRSYPDAGYVALDVYTTKEDGKPDLAVDVFKTGLGAAFTQVTIVTRGTEEGLKVHAPEVPMEGRRGSNPEAEGSSPSGSADDREAQQDERPATNRAMFRGQ